MILPSLAVVVAAALGIWVLRPLAGRRRGPVPPPDTRRAELLEAKYAVYRSILDLELDHQLGKVAPDDYQELRHEHEQEAIGLLRELDDEGAPLPGEVSGSDAGALDVLEREIAEARRRRSGR
ncbi:MAG TPA: hypothetical protein VII47_08850 [Actinomycetota bacterium]